MMERLRLQSKQTSSGEYTTSTGNEILIDETQEEGQIGVVVRRSNRDSDGGSPIDNQPADNRNVEFTPYLSSRGGQYEDKQRRSTSRSPSIDIDKFAHNGIISEMNI